MVAILLTGASSFTGLWIAEGLHSAGYEVVAPLRRAQTDYTGIRGERVRRLARSAQIMFETPFASPAFIDAIKKGGFAILAHHAADIDDYRSPQYDAIEGLARNTRGAKEALEAFAGTGGVGIISTSTYFEAGEAGDGPTGLAVTPYGLSKGLTNETLRHFSRWSGLRFGRFVISGPFGPLEEGRMAWSLFQSWYADKPGVVRTPAYVRDNIPVDLLGLAYADLTTELLSGATEAVRRPAGFVGTQAEFAERIAAAMRPRLGLPCLVDALPQTRFEEPLVRVNTDDWLLAGWDEQSFWDDYAAYYRRIAAAGALAAPA